MRIGEPLLRIGNLYRIYSEKYTRKKRNKIEKKTDRNEEKYVSRRVDDEAKPSTPTSGHRDEHR